MTSVPHRLPPHVSQHTRLHHPPAPDLVKGRKYVVGKLDLSNGAVALCRSAHSEPHYALLRQRRVEHALAAVPVQQAAAAHEHAPKRNVLAKAQRPGEAGGRCRGGGGVLSGLELPSRGEAGGQG